MHFYSTKNRLSRSLSASAFAAVAVIDDEWWPSFSLLLKESNEHWVGLENPGPHWAHGSLRQKSVLARACKLQARSSFFGSEYAQRPSSFKIRDGFF